MVINLKLGIISLGICKLLIKEILGISSEGWIIENIY